MLSLQVPGWSAAESAGATGRLSAAETTARAAATAADRSKAGMVTTQMIYLAVSSLTMAAPLADAACWAVTVNSAGSGRWPPSLSTVMVMS
jgi:hypothetical protein